MADRNLRGIRLGAQSLQSEEGVVFHDRKQHTYRCTSCARETTMTFAADAELPEAWECRVCGSEALRVIGDGTANVDHSDDKTPRSHWDMLLERRSVADLEELLEERLAYIRSLRGSGEDVSKLTA